MEFKSECPDTGLIAIFEGEANLRDVSKQTSAERTVFLMFPNIQYFEFLPRTLVVFLFHPKSSKMLQHSGGVNVDKRATRLIGPEHPNVVLKKTVIFDSLSQLSDKLSFVIVNIFPTNVAYYSQVISVF